MPVRKMLSVPRVCKSLFCVYVCVCMCVGLCVCVCILANLSVYHFLLHSETICVFLSNYQDPSHQQFEDLPDIC